MKNELQEKITELLAVGLAKDNDSLAALEKASELGSGEADALLGSIYKSGELVEKDYDKTEKYFRSAIEKGYIRGYAPLINFFYKHPERTEEILQKGDQAFRDAIDHCYKNGPKQPGLYLDFGDICMQIGDYEEAKKAYKLFEAHHNIPGNFHSRTVAGQIERELQDSINNKTPSGTKPDSTTSVGDDEPKKLTESISKKTLSK